LQSSCGRRNRRPESCEKSLGVKVYRSLLSLDLVPSLRDHCPPTWSIGSSPPPGLVPQSIWSAQFDLPFNFVSGSTAASSWFCLLPDLMPLYRHTHGCFQFGSPSPTDGCSSQRRGDLICVPLLRHRFAASCKAVRCSRTAIFASGDSNTRGAGRERSSVVLNAPEPTV
jgi:hypothetical protein